MAQPLYVIGGQQRGARTMLEQGDSWYGYAKGLVLRVDGDDITQELEYESPPGVCGPEDPILFKSGTVRGDRLYSCTQTEVIVWSLPDFEMVRHVSLPCFNDVHHVVPTPHGTLLIANSGLEMVLELAEDDSIVQAWSMLGEDPWARFSRDVDYRTGIDLKPHHAHPNHLCYLGDEPFATRFELRDAVSLFDPTRRIAIDRERAHDGVVADGHVHFTTVDGSIVIADATTLEVTEVVPLTSLVDDDVVLGWCRGLLVDDDHVWVGFSRIRATKFRQTVSWIRSGLTKSRPTRIAKYRRDDWSCVEEIDLEPAGLNAVFTIARVPEL